MAIEAVVAIDCIAVLCTAQVTCAYSY